MNNSNPLKIIIRTPNWLGDLMMSTAFIEAVLERYPNAVVDLIVRKGFEGLPLPHRGRIIPFDKKEDGVIGLGRRLKKENYDKFFVLPPSFSAALMAFLSGASEKIGYVGGGRSLLLSPRKKYLAMHRSQHLISEYLQLLDPKIDVDRYFPNLNVDEKWCEKQLDGKIGQLPERFVVFSPGAMYGPAKQWPVQYFKKLASLFSEKGIWTVVTGTDKDAKLGEIIAEGNGNVLNFCGKTGLNELIALLKKSSMLVSNDSGAMHLMSALRKPQVAIFGSTSTVWTSPKNSKSSLLTLRKSCSPCYKRECPLGHYDCLSGITPKEVFEASLKLIVI